MRLDEQRREFMGEAVAALQEATASGKGYRAADAHRDVLERAPDVALVLALRQQRAAGYADVS